MTRISTGMMYLQSLSTLQSKQASLASLQQQIASAQKLQTAKDDPVGAGTAVGLDRAVAELERFGKNADTVRHRLNMQENTLATTGDIVGRLQTLTIQANSNVLLDSDRDAIAVEVRSLRDSLFDLANTADGTGRYLFGGAQDGVAPFASVAGDTRYAGDQFQRQTEVAPQTFVADALPGSEVFMRIRTGDGRLDATAGTGNTGTGVIGGFGVTSSGDWNGGSYRIEFADQGSYRVLDANGAEIATGTHAPGDAIEFAGARLVVSGNPASGDTFTLGAAGTRDVFATIDNLLGALAMQPASSAERAAQHNALQGSLRDLSTAQNHLIDARAGGGAQLAALDNADSLREAQSVTIKTTLSGVRDLDMADAIMRFNLEKTALDAAQLSYVQMQRLSLFDLLR